MYNVSDTVFPNITPRYIANISPTTTTTTSHGIITGSILNDMGCFLPYKVKREIWEFLD